MVGTSGEQSPKVAHLKTSLLVKESELYPGEQWKSLKDFGRTSEKKAPFRKIHLENRKGLSDSGQLGGSL